MTENLNALFKPDIPPNIIEGFTERRRQAILHNTGALQTALFNSAHFSCIATDANGIIQIFNVGAERMLGYTAVEVINKVTLAYFSDSQEIIARAETLSVELGTPIAPGFEALVFKAARGIEDIYELTCIRKDGSRLSAVVSVTALRDEHDTIIGYLLIATDNSARKQAEEELQKAATRLEHLNAEKTLLASDAHYRQLVESIDEGFCIIEKVDGADGEPLDFRYVETNPAFTTQSGLSDVVGKTIRQVMPELSEDWFLTYDTVLGTGEPIRFERELVGQGRVLELHAFRIKDGTHNRVGVSFTDITERKRNQMLLIAQKKVLELAANGTPLEEILEYVVRSVQQLSGEQSRASLFLLEPDGLHLRFVVGMGLSEEYTRAVDNFEVGPHMPSCGSAAFTGQPVIVADVTKDPLWAPFLSLAQQHEIRALWSQPLRTLGGKVLGTLAQYFRTPREPKPDEIDAVQLLSQTAALVIEGSRAAAQRREAEDALRKNEWRLRYATESARLTYVERDMAGGGMLRAENYAAVMGYVPPPEQDADVSVGARILLEHVVSQDRLRVKDALQQFIGDNYAGKIDYRVLGDDQIERWIETRWSVELGPDGKRLNSFATHLDITERKQIEQALRQSEERFRAAVGIVSSLIWTNNADGLMEGEQPGWGNFTGQTREEYQGYGWSKAVHPEDAQPTIDAWQQAVGEKRIFEFAHRIRRRDGEWRLCSIRALPLLGEDGMIREWVGVHTDITERKQAEDTLRQSEEFNRSIINSSPDCIKVLELEGNLLSMLNGQELLGIEDIRPFLNKSWLKFWEGGDYQAAQAAVTVARAGGTGKFVGFFRTLRDEPKWWDVTISPIFDANGKPSRLLAVSRDVTSRKRAEMNIEFLASVSEDLVRSTNMEEMTRTVGAKMAAYLNLSLCAFVEIDETAEQVTISYDWHRQDVPGLVGVYRLADFVGEEFLRAARAGEIAVVRDTAMDPRTNPESFAPLKIASFISVPLIRDGQWRFALCLYHSTPYDWREDEVELMRELTTRIWTRLERLQAEDALRVSQERLWQALDSAELGSWNLDPVTGLFTSDEGFQAIFGASVEGSNEKEAIDNIHPDDRCRTQQAVTAAIRVDHPAPYDIEYRVVHPDGSLHWVHAKGRARFSGSGQQRKLVSFAGKVDDITARKQAEEALIQSEERYRSLFNSIDEGFCVIEMIFDEHDQPIDYLFLEVNPSFERQSGLFEPAGKRALELVPTLEENWFEIYGKVALTGEPLRISSEVKSMGLWLDLYACRVGGSDSRKVAVVFNNITERKQSELALHQSEERFRALFDRGPIAMYSCDLAGTIQEYNRGAVDLWGMEPQRGESDEHFGGSLKWYFPDGTLMSYAQTPMAEILKGDTPAAYDMEVVIERLDGSRIIAIANIVPLKNDQGEITGAINCFYDITDRKQVELNLKHAIVAAEKANRAKSHFLSNMSHELRTPLNAILGFAQLLEAGSPPLTDIQAKRLLHIIKAGWYLLELINEILDLAVIESGRINLLQETVPLAGVMAECQAMIEPQAQKHNVQIVWYPFESFWLAHADRIRVKQVLLNLLSNAIKYNRPHGSVEVKCTNIAERIRISIKDSGEGMSADKLAQLFQAFNRLGQEAGVEQGTGIGLVVTKKLVELMGGEIGVESTVGVGSEFWIELSGGVSLALDTENTPPPPTAQISPS